MVQAVLVEGTAPVIDGRLEDPAWVTAQSVSGFIQRGPNPGEPATERTEVRVLYTRDALYVAARMHDAPDSLATALFRRDDDGYSDWFSLQVDANRDRRTALSFEISPRGVKRDLAIYNDSDEDRSWNAVWDGAAHIDSLGWTAEMRIPFSQLRFTHSSAQNVWGVNFRREIARRGEVSFWAPTPPDAPGFVSRFGELAGLRSISQPHHFELVPYVSSRMARRPGDPTNPIFRANSVTGSAGADIRYRVTSQLTLDATVNPDFGQVEVDPAVVNLTAFETFFPERRPFFVEGTDALRFGNTRTSISYNVPTLFYSRRIGQAPTVGLSGSEYRFVDVPAQTTIAGAAKLTGKIGGWSIGLLDAVTTPERARYMDAEGLERLASVQPLTNNFVARLRRDLDGGKARVGAYATSVMRSLDSPVLTASLHSQAYVGGVDVERTFAAGDWVLSGYLTRSLVHGDPAAIMATQQSSSRYYQQPEAEHLSLDPARTSLTGYSGQLTLSRVGGRHWRGSVSYQEVSPGFEVNDLGYQARADMRAVTGAITYQENEPSRFFRNYGLFGYTLNTWNLGGTRLLNSVNVTTYGTLKNFWFLKGSLGYDLRSYNDRLTRGGPLAVYPAHRYASVSVSTDSRKRYSVTNNLSLTTNEAGSWSTTMGLSADLRPSSAISLSVGPQFTRIFSQAQYVARRVDSTATETYGSRYVFADLNQTTVSLGTRVNWTFTPDLSLQLYLQPLVAAAKYGHYKELARPRSYDFVTYGQDRGTADADGNGSTLVDPDGDGPAQPFSVRDPSFNFRSLRGNAVLRWEFRPGSTLFAVWQQQRSGAVADGDFDFGRDTRALFREPAENVLMLKASFWLGY